MEHQHHTHWECNHWNMSYCGRCDVAYCRSCNREWGSVYSTAHFPSFTTCDTTTGNDVTYTTSSSTAVMQKCEHKPDAIS